MTRTRRADADRAGFTLLETVVVVALVGVILVVTLPSYSSYASNQRTLAAAHTLAADLRTARQEAVTRRAPITVSFAGRDGACGAGSGGSYAMTHGGSVLKRVCFPDDVEWSPAPAAPLVFESAGAPRIGASLMVRSARTDERHWVTVAADSGAVTSDVP